MPIEIFSFVEILITWNHVLTYNVVCIIRL